MTEKLVTEKKLKKCKFKKVEGCHNQRKNKCIYFQLKRKETIYGYPRQSLFSDTLQERMLISRRNFIFVSGVIMITLGHELIFQCLMTKPFDKPLL